MYAYFGDKNSLFGAVLEANVDALINAVPFTADELPGYASGCMTPVLRTLNLFASQPGCAPSGSVPVSW